MEDINYQEVNFHIYCKTCKHEELKETEDPCNECLEQPFNENSDKPIKWESKTVEEV